MVETENVLLARAAAFPEFANLEQLTAHTLRDLASREGVDFATAVLYDRVKRAPENAPFIAQIDRWQTGRCNPSARLQATVGIVPAAFYKESPKSGADGGLVREEASRLGIRCELVPLSSTGTLVENAQTIVNWLANHRGERIIIISLCKGGADVKFALRDEDSRRHFNEVFAWVNICGTLNGSPVAEWLLASTPGFFAAWAYCKCRGHNLAALREIAASPQHPLSAPLRLPASMRLINVVGFPLRRHLTNRFMRQCHQRVSRQGPTDGGLLLADACHLPGTLYPVWGADHYLRPEARARQIISAILELLTTESSPAAHERGKQTPAIDQTAQTPSA
jgi:hypothetical protein